MTAGRLIRHDDCPATPWKNGGGTTREVAAHPPGASLDDFHWRLSMAWVAAPGAFSHFAGVDRIIAILKGTLALDIEGIGPMRLDDQSTPFPFAGDTPTFGAPLYGDVLDLNLMVRRGTMTAHMHRIGAGAVPLEPDTNILVALDICTLSFGATDIAMHRHDAYIWDRAQDEAALVDRPALLLHIAPCAAD